MTANSQTAKQPNSQTAKQPNNINNLAAQLFNNSGIF
jgi:hypothetical protein